MSDGVGVAAEVEPPPPPPQAVSTSDIKPIRMGCLKTGDNLFEWLNEVFPVIFIGIFMIPDGGAIER